jgi:hypothetical protein
MFLKKLLYVEEAPKHVLIVWIFNTTIYDTSLLMSKKCLYMWISAYPLVENIFFVNFPNLLWIWYFANMYLTHSLRIKNMERHMPYLFKPLVPTRDKPVLGSFAWSHTIFGFFETIFSSASRNKFCVSTNFMILGATDQKLWVFEVSRRSSGS